MPDELKTAERLMETEPDSALHILQRMSPDNYKSAPDRALYGLLLIRALDKNMLPLQPDSLLDFSTKYYLTHGDDEHLATCYLYKGRKYKYASKYEKAMEFYLKGLDMAQTKNYTLLLARINLDLGDIYLQQRDYNLSRQKFNLAYTHFVSIKMQELAFYSLLSVGRTYHNAKDYKKAQNFYRKVNSYAKDSLQKASLLQERAINYYDDHKLDSAKVYFQQVIRYPYVGNNLAIRYYYFADLLFDLKQLDSAFYYAKNAFRYQPDILTQRECYRILTNVDYLKGNMKEMSMYMNKYVALGDSLRRIDTQTKGSVLEVLYKTDVEVVKSRSRFWYLFAFFVIMLVTGGLFYFRYTHRNRLEKLQAEETHVKQKAGIRKEVMINHRNALHKKIDAIKSKQSDERKKASPAEKEQLNRKMYEVLLHLNDIDIFYRGMDAVLNNLVTKLRTRYPMLTAKEISWCCLSLLHVPITDIYMLLDYKVDSLKKMRQRLAQKAGLTGVTELDGFLHDILSE